MNELTSIEKYLRKLYKISEDYIVVVVNDGEENGISFENRFKAALIAVLKNNNTLVMLKNRFSTVDQIIKIPSFKTHFADFDY